MPDLPDLPDVPDENLPADPADDDPGQPWMDAAGWRPDSDPDRLRAAVLAAAVRAADGAEFEIDWESQPGFALVSYPLDDGTFGPPHVLDLKAIDRRLGDG